MTSGIYKLTFSSKNFYIGKSINIENRWKQHFDDFKKGVHAVNMQHEFDTYGFPTTHIVWTCHPDYLDIMERLTISELKPSLNTVFPEPFDPEDADLLASKPPQLQHSVPTLIRDHLLIHAKLAQLKDNGVYLPEEVKDLEMQIKVMEKRLKEFEDLPLFSRIFNYPTFRSLEATYKMIRKIRQ